MQLQQTILIKKNINFMKEESNPALKSDSSIYMNQKMLKNIF